jgi:hypothetical protein
MATRIKCRLIHNNGTIQDLNMPERKEFIVLGKPRFNYIKVDLKEQPLIERVKFKWEGELNGIQIYIQETPNV